MLRLPNGSRALQALREHRIRRVDKRLNQLHLHRLRLPRRPRSLDAIVSQHVLDDFVEHFGLHRLLYEMARASLQCRHDVFLVADRRHHHDARVGMLAHDPLRGLDAFHLRHGDVHEHDVGMWCGRIR